MLFSLEVNTSNNADAQLSTSINAGNVSGVNRVLHQTMSQHTHLRFHGLPLLLGRQLNRLVAQQEQAYTNPIRLFNSRNPFCQRSARNGCYVHDARVTRKKWEPPRAVCIAPISW